MGPAQTRIFVSKGGANAHHHVKIRTVATMDVVDRAALAGPGIPASAVHVYASRSVKAWLAVTMDAAVCVVAVPRPIHVLMGSAPAIQTAKERHADRTAVVVRAAPAVAAMVPTQRSVMRQAPV